MDAKTHAPCTKCCFLSAAALDCYDRAASDMPETRSEHFPLRPLDALNRVLGSVESVRNGRALYALLATFASAGLLLAMAESALARGGVIWGTVWAGISLTLLFYGSNAAGLLLLDEARRVPVRSVEQALRDALRSAHRLLVVLALLGLAAAGLLAVLLLLLWTTRVPVIGPALLGLVLPLAVIVVGLAVLSGVAVAAPLAAPAVWSGCTARETLFMLAHHVRHRLVFVALLMTAVSGLAALVGVLVTFVVVSGGRVVSALAVLATGVELPPQVLMAGLFGHGLRSLGAAGAPMAQSAYGQAALAGGGIVFMLALVLPALVYLRGTCSVFLALEQRDGSEIEGGAEPAAP